MSCFIEINQNKLPVEVAISLKDLKLGQMFKVPPVSSMIFPFKKANYFKFWMKNTAAPLDILFCFKNEITQIEEGIPFSKNSIIANSPTDLVIEFNKGMVNLLNIKIGDKVKVNYSINKIAELYKEWYLIKN